MLLHIIHIYKEKTVLHYFKAVHTQVYNWDLHVVRREENSNVQAIQSSDELQFPTCCRGAGLTKGLTPGPDSKAGPAESLQ